MVHDVYLIGLWDDSMAYYMVDQTEWDKLDIHDIRSMNFDTFTSWDLLEYSMSPEEFEEFKIQQGSNPLEGTFEDVWSLGQILELVKLNKINVLDTVETYAM